MNSTLKRVFASIVLAQMGFQTVSALPSFSMPKVSMPSISMPSMPKVSMPSLSMPSMPSISRESVVAGLVSAKDAVASQITLQNGKYAAAGIVTLAGLYAGYKGVKACTEYKIGKNLNFFSNLGFLGSNKNEAKPAVVKADRKAQVLSIATEALKTKSTVRRAEALELVKDNSKATNMLCEFFTTVSQLSRANGATIEKKTKEANSKLNAIEFELNRA